MKLQFMFYPYGLASSETGQTLDGLGRDYNLEQDNEIKEDRWLQNKVSGLKYFCLFPSQMP